MNKHVPSLLATSENAKMRTCSSVCGSLGCWLAGQLDSRWGGFACA